MRGKPRGHDEPTQHNPLKNTLRDHSKSTLNCDEKLCQATQ